MKRLDEVFQNAVNEISKGYSSLVGSFLEDNGVDGETGNIYESVVSGVKGRIDDYRKALSGNAELESLKGTQDAWLLDDDAYVASVLRKGTAAPVSSAVSAASAPYSMDEARIGLDLSMLAMKTDELKKHSGVGGSIAGLLQRTLDGFTNAYLDHMDSELTAKRKKRLMAGDKKGYVALNRDVIGMCITGLWGSIAPMETRCGHCGRVRSMAR